MTKVDGEWCIIHKFAGSQLRNVTYHVKCNECYAVPPDNNLFDSVEDHDCNDYNSDYYDSQQEDFVHQQNSFSLPHSDCPSASIPVTPPELSDPVGSPDLHDTISDLPVQLHHTPDLSELPSCASLELQSGYNPNAVDYTEESSQLPLSLPQCPGHTKKTSKCFDDFELYGREEGESDYASPPCYVA